MNQQPTHPPKPVPNWKQIAVHFDDDQRHVFETRLGILCEGREPTLIQIAWALEEAQNMRRSQPQRKV